MKKLICAFRNLSMDLKKATKNKNIINKPLLDGADSTMTSITVSLMQQDVNREKYALLHHLYFFALKLLLNSVYLLIT